MSAANEVPMDAEHPSLLLPEDTIAAPPSVVGGLSVGEERKHRIWSCELIQECGILLKLPQVVLATAQTLLHRFYYRRTFQQFDGHIIAMACIFLAAKVEEDPRRIRDVLNVMYHVKLRREHKPPKVLKLAGKLYVRWKAEVLRSERFVLKELGFSMYNITEHPHKFILYYVAILNGSETLAQRAWSLLNDSLRIPLCTRYHAENIACAAIYLASRVLLEPLPPLPWFEIFGTSREIMLEICEEILTLYLQPKLLWLPSLEPERARDDVDEDEPSAVSPSHFPPHLWGEMPKTATETPEQGVKHAEVAVSSSRPRSRSRDRIDRADSGGARDDRRREPSISPRRSEYRRDRSRSPRRDRSRSSRRDRSRSRRRDRSRSPRRDGGRERSRSPYRRGPRDARSRSRSPYDRNRRLQRSRSPRRYANGDNRPGNRNATDSYRREAARSRDRGSARSRSPRRYHNASRD